MLVYLLEIDSPLVTLMPFSSLPTQKFELPTTPHLHQVSHPRQPNRDVSRVHKLNVNKREMQLFEVKSRDDTWPGDQLGASRNNTRFFVNA